MELEVVYATSKFCAYIGSSLLKFPDLKDKRRMENLRAIFRILIKHEKLLPLVPYLIKLPLSYWPIIAFKIKRLILLLVIVLKIKMKERI